MRLLVASLVLQSRCLLFACIVATLSCGDDGGADTGPVDAGDDVRAPRDAIRPFDSGPPPPDVFDAGDDAPDAGDDAGPWTSEWNTEPTIEIVDAAPCEEWDAIDPFPRGLPADSTPRQLWQFRPELDPMYEAGRARFNNQVLDPVVSPDGTIWVKGPSSTDVMQVDREGRMRRWYYTGALEDGSVLRGPMVALPDGTLVVNRFRGDIGSIIHLDPDWDQRTWTVPRGTPILTGLQAGASTQFAVGPGGMLYITGRNYVTATCQGRRVMWVLTNRAKPGSHPRAGTLWPRVMPDGDLVLSGLDQRVHRVSAGGDVLSSVLYAPGKNRDWWRYVERYSDNAFLVHLFDAADLNGGVDRALQLIVEGTSGPEFFGRYPRMTPQGSLYFSTATAHFVAESPTYLAESYEVESGPTRGLRLADGTLLRSSGGVIERMQLNEGVLTQLWQTSGSVADSAIDSSGTLYTANSSGLTAVQLDQLPPSLSSCVNLPCNAHRDNWIRPAE